jgi:flagellum-specific peptidoglycan hydrolase FlgJ
MRDKFIKFLEKYGIWIFAIWILLINILIAGNIKGQTIEEVRSELNKYKIAEEHKDIIIAQSILETGWYESLWCKNFHNIFGLTMKVDTFRVSQTFTKWQYSVRSYYYQIYIKFTKLKAPKTYYAFLVDLPYAMDPEYINKLKKIVNDL